MTDEELREYFEESAGRRLEEIRRVLPSLTFDRDALAVAARHFHAFAGMGGTYGYPRISQLGDTVEQELVPLMRAGGMPSAEMVERWRRVAEDIKGILPRPCGPPDVS